MHKSSLSSTRLIRSYNAASILKTLYREGHCSRSHLTDLTKMSPSTVTRIISQLIKQGILREGKAEKSTGGRKPINIHLDYSKLFIVGIQLLRDRAAVGISDLKGRLMACQSYRPYALDSDFLLRELGDKVESLLTSSGINRAHILGVGVAISGVVDSSNGTMKRSVNLGWRDVEVANILGKSLDLPVYVENDANAATLAEYWFGHAKDVSNLLFLKTDTGVGSGIIQDQRLLTGSQGMAGEIGHIPLFENGHPCRCGQRGCLETYVYLQDVLDRYAKRTGNTLSPASFFHSAKNHDPNVQFIVDDAARALTKAITFAGILLDLEMVVISGIWGELGNDFLANIAREYQIVLDRTGLNKSITITGSKLGDNCDLLGAVGLVIDRWFAPPI